MLPVRQQQWECPLWREAGGKSASAFECGVKKEYQKISMAKTKPAGVLIDILRVTEEMVAIMRLNKDQIARKVKLSAEHPSNKKIAKLAK